MSNIVSGETCRYAKPPRCGHASLGNARAPGWLAREMPLSHARPHTELLGRALGMPREPEQTTGGRRSIAPSPPILAHPESPACMRRSRTPSVASINLSEERFFKLFFTRHNLREPSSVEILTVSEPLSDGNDGYGNSGM